MRHFRNGHGVRRGTALIAFALLAAACGDAGTGPATGALEVSVATTGEDLDGDGYTVTVGEESASVPANGSATFAPIDAGERSLELSGIAANCSLSGDNPRGVTVSEGDTAQVSLAVSCAARQGGLTVITESSGSDIDADGYTIFLDGQETASAGATDTVELTGLAEDDHTVELRNVASNCTIAGDNPRTVAVAHGTTADMSFSASCAAREGYVAVMTQTSGDEADQDGYTILLDGASAGMIEPNDTVVLSGVAEGDRSIELDGVADNCGLTGDNPRTMGVAYDDTTSTAFTAACEYNRLAFASTRDADGDTEIFTMNSDGSGLTKLTDNTIADYRPAWSPDESQIVFTRRDGGVTNIWLMNADGTGAKKVTGDTTSADHSPDWSPDGTRIAFTSDRTGNADIFVVGTDGSAATPITTHASVDVYPEWSPDGSKLVFASERDGNREIYVANADGTGVTRLTNDPAEDTWPSWSPDGSQIVFSSARNGANHLFVMDADGGSLRQLTSGSAVTDIQPSWLHDGRIAFASDRSGSYQVHTVMENGSRISTLTSDGQNLNPDWTP